MKKLTDIVAVKPWVGWLLYLVSILIVFLIGVLASTIVERRSEANLILRNVKPLADWEPRNEVWVKIIRSNMNLILLLLIPDLQASMGDQRRLTCFPDILN